MRGRWLTQSFGPGSSWCIRAPRSFGIVPIVGVAAMLLAFSSRVTAPAIAGDLTIEPSLEVRESYSDNVDLDSPGNETAAAISEVVPGMRIRSQSARATGALDALPVFRYQTAGEDKGITIDPNLTGLGNLEAIEDLFFVDADASVSQQVLNNREAASTANQSTVQVYRLSPYLHKRFGGFAEAEARYRLGQVFIDNQDTGIGTQASDSTTNGFNAFVQSGDDFTRLSWKLDGLISEEKRTEDNDISRREGGLELQYAVNRSITLIAGGGYQVFDDGTPQNEVDGPTWHFGFRWRPGPRTDLTATFGKRDNDQNANVRFSYKVGPRTTVTARYSRVLETSQERLVRTLSQIGLEGETNNFINQDTGDPFSPNPSPFSINNETVRVEAVEVGLNGVRGRNTFGVNASYQEEVTEPSGETQDVTRGSARFSRRLSPHLTANLFAGYERTEFDDGQTDNEYIATGGMSYQLSRSLRAGLEYNYRLQNSNVATAEFEENRVTANLRVAF